MSDNGYGDTDQHNAPDRGGGRNTTASDGLPGYPVDGHPGLRAGLFGSGRGLLGMARVSDLVARQPGDDQTPFADRGDPRLMRVSDPVMDWERNSWRWNDPEAIAYDLDRKRRQLAEAKRISDSADLVSGGQLGIGALGKAAHGMAVTDSLALSGGTYLVGQYMNRAEIPRIEEEIKALQSRQDQLTADLRPELGLRQRLP